MTSQLNVDTIVDKAGSGGTNVKIGNTSTYVGEGGSGTQNTVQGLTKFWIKVSSSHTSLDDSFNCSTTTDVSTGVLGGTLTNAMANTDYVQHVSLLASNYAGAVNFARWSPHADTTNRTTSETRSVYAFATGSTVSFQDANDSAMVSVEGDLA